MNTLDSNINSGFLYYTPFEVHVHNDAIDADSGIYASDDERLLHPLVPSTVSSSIENHC